MGKSGTTAQVSKYYMSMHVGICASGAGLELLVLKFGDKVAWRGQMKRNQVTLIDEEELFGGEKKEGGVFGLMWWLNGHAKQVLPGPLFSRLGLTFGTSPGFRGLASVFLTGLRNDNTDGTDFLWPDFADLNGTIADEAGFLQSANNPYLKSITARVRRAPEGLNPATALIQLPNDSADNEQWGANGAHIIFECMTNRDWGMGESFGAFNIGSFEQCAQTLYDEEFALNMIWTRQSKIENFIKEVLDHVQGAIFVDPATGKHTMKLLRAVDPEIELPLVSPDNARLTGFKMKAWGDIANEITVTWTNPETSKEETVTAQDLAAISMQGAQPASDSRNYYAIGSQATAISVAERDLAAVVHPIATCEAEVMKSFWRTVIYDVVELNWPEYGIESAFFRVGGVSAGNSSNTVKLTLYEDVFSLDRASYLGGGGTEWVDPSLPPEPLVNYQVGTAPAFLTAAALGLVDPGDLVYPEVISNITVGPDSIDDVSYQLVGYVTNVSGTLVRQSLGERTLRGTWETDAPLDAEVSTLLSDFPGYLGNPPLEGQFILIGDGPDEETEIAVVRSVTGAGWLLDRGMLDTVPREWPIGTRLWAIPSDRVVADDTVRSAFATASYHFRTRTSIGLLPIADAPQVDIVLSERPHLPNRPANVKIEGTAFGTYDLGAGTSMTVTWARRNRIDESTQAFLWDDADMTPEVGQTTSLVLMEADRTPITTITGITGTSYELLKTSFSGNLDAIVRVVAVRDGMESLTGHEILVTMDP